MRQLDSQKRRRIRRHRPRHGRAHAWKKSSQPPTPIEAGNRAADRRPPLRALQATLHGIDGEHRDPHRHAGCPSRRHHSREAEIAGRVPVSVFGCHFPLDVLVRREIRCAAGAVAREGHGAAAEDGFDAAFFVELADDVEAAGVAGLFARGEGFLALDLEEDFDAFEGGGDEGHGDGGEEAGEGDLGDGEWLGGGEGGGGGEGPDEGFAHVVALV